MRAARSYHRWLKVRFDFLHAQRRDALWRVLKGLLRKGKLSVTGLGRARSGTTKHAIKAADRLVGNRSLHQSREAIYHAIASTFVGQRPVIAVDITEVRPFVCAMTASVVVEGRGIPIATLIRNKKTVMKSDCRRRFLKMLSRVLPDGCIPTLVTDAGFQTTWFEAVRKMGWHFVGRVRHRTRIYVQNRWCSPQEIHATARGRPRSLGIVPLRKYNPSPQRVVLAARPKSKRRFRKTKRGKRARHYNDLRATKSAREPWLLATSLRTSARKVVKVYATRMQIEQNYRDTKNSRWGFSFSESRSRTHRRLETLLLIGAIAMAMVLAIGCAAEQRGLQRLEQANTVKSHRVLSWFMLGIICIRADHQAASHTLIRDGTVLLRKRIAMLEKLVI